MSEEDADAEAIRKIKAEDLLKKHEGKKYTALLKKIYTDHFIDVNLARRKMGMVFQHFNLFGNLTVLQNLTLAPDTAWDSNQRAGGGKGIGAARANRTF